MISPMVPKQWVRQKIRNRRNSFEVTRFSNGTFSNLSIDLVKETPYTLFVNDEEILSISLNCRLIWWSFFNRVSWFRKKGS